MYICIGYLLIRFLDISRNFYKCMNIIIILLYFLKFVLFILMIIIKIIIFFYLCNKDIFNFFY